MVSNKYYLGDLITQRREKNPGGDLPIRGVSKEGLQPPKQIDADTSIYNLYYRNDFIYNPARMELGSIAFNDEYDRAICSSLYEVFYVHRRDLVIPEYLALFVKHPEFARYCNYIGNGSAREYCRFDNISGIPIYLPSIDEQRKIVHDYQVITDRIELLRKMNENLENIMLATFQRITENKSLKMTLNDYCDFQEGYVNPDQGKIEYFDGDIKWLRGVDFTSTVITETSRTLTNEGFQSAGKSALLFQPNTIVITKSGTIGKIGILADYMCGNRATINIKPKNSSHLACLYFFLKSIQSQFQDLAVGTAQVNLYVSVMQAIQCPNFDNSYVEFNKQAGLIVQIITLKSKEIIRLQELLSLILDSYIL